MQMIIASRLVDGRVVFMDADTDWTDSIEDGVCLEAENDTARLMTAAELAIENCEIVDPYPIEVVVEDGERRPAEVREAIRAFGPSVRTDQLSSNE
jgi:hypothetical protein